MVHIRTSYNMFFVGRTFNASVVGSETLQMHAFKLQLHVQCWYPTAILLGIDETHSNLIHYMQSTIMRTL